MSPAAKIMQKPQLPATLPAIEDEETLYSWCASVHALASGTNSGDTSHALFGNGHSSRQHDIPRGLRALQGHLSCFSDNCIELLRIHTVAACYLPFMAPSDLELLATEISAGVKPHWRRRLLSASRSLPIKHPLRFCSACCAEDTAAAGRPFWHTQHQFPATWVCTRHSEALWIFSGHPRRWLLPSPGQKGSARLSDLNTNVATTAAAVGQAISKLRIINTDALRSCTLNRLRDIGVIHSLGGARHDRLASWFRNSAMGRMCAADTSGTSALADGNWVPAHLWRKKRDHPARWIALWSALQWRSADEACSALMEACSDAAPTDKGQYLLFEPQEHPTRAPDHVYAAFEICESYEAVMAHLHVSRGDVVRWLESDPELRRIWKQGIHSRRLHVTEHRLRKSMIDWLASKPNLEGFLESNEADLHWLARNAPSAHQALVGNLHRRGAVAKTLF